MVEKVRQKNPGIFQRRKKLKNDLERVNQEMYLRNLELAQTNRTLSLLRTIDNLVLESPASTKELCNEMAYEIAKTTNYPLVAILAFEKYKSDLLKIYGWHSNVSVDTKAHNFIEELEIPESEISWLGSDEPSIAVTIADAIRTHHPFTGGWNGKHAIGISQAMGVHSAYFVKLTARGRLVGLMVVGLASEEATTAVTANDQDLINRLAGAVGIALDNKILLDENTRVLEQLKKTNDKLKALDETKDEFISMASHQLRTPLTSIKGYVSMVLEGDAGKVTTHQQKLLTEAFKSSERMVGLIGDFLNVSRLQTGKFVIEKSPFDLKAMVKQEVSELDPLASTHDIKLKLKITGKGFQMFADESKIRQVIMNFIDNAIYYSYPNSTIVVHLDKAEKSVSLRVVDTGIGVPKAEQEHLFNKFFRAPNARKQRPDGTGVGLFLAKRVIMEHDGKIIFSSKEGKGSTFGFSLPIEPIPETYKAAAKPTDIPA
jgi:signal transduction histidine kinase